MTGAVPVQDRLDIEDCTDRCAHAADTACSLQKIQVIHGKILTGMRHLRIHDRSCFPDVYALTAELCRADSKQSVAKAASVGVDHIDYENLLINESADNIEVSLDEYPVAQTVTLTVEASIT